MTKKQIGLMSALLTFIFVVPVVAQPSLSLIWSQQCDGEVRVRDTTVECWQEGTDPPPAATPTTQPSATPAATATPTATVEPGIVMCQHDSLLWHDLYDEGRECRYDHEHGDDPALANGVFGEAGAWFGSPGWEVGSPAVPAHELEEGHRFWKIYAATGLTAADQNLIGPDGEYIRSFRVQTHAASGGNGIKHRYHGMVVEIEACRPEGTVRPGGIPKPVSETDETCGTYQASGTLDYGNLFLRETGDPYVFLLPHEPDGQNVVLPFGQRIHSAIPTNTQATWYPKSWPGDMGYVDIQVVISDGWSWVEPGNEDVTVNQVGSGNGTRRQLHVLAINVQSWMPHDGSFPVNTLGYSDPSCATWHDGCGLLTLEDWPANDLLRYAELVNWREYDTSPSGQPWITFPN